MRLVIDQDVYELNPYSGALPFGQQVLLTLLSEAVERSIPLSYEGLIEQQGLKSRLPLESRIKHLIEKGALAPLLRWKDCPICSWSPQARAMCGCCEGTGRIAIAPHGSCFACGEPVPLGDRLCGDHGGDAIGIGEEPSP